MLDGEPESGIEKTGARDKVVKGDPRLVVTCDEVEEVVFGSRFDPEKVFGRRKNRRTRAMGDPNAPWRSVDMESGDEGQQDESSDGENPSSDDEGGGIPLVDNFNISHVRPSQADSDINFSAGGGERSRAEKIEESAADLEKRRQGQKQADEREVVRRAARRVIVFGVEMPKTESGGPKGGMKSKSKPKAKGKKRKGESEDVDVDDEQSGGSEMQVRKAEALMNGMVVEPSFAKGNWSIRWRE